MGTEKDITTGFVGDAKVLIVDSSASFASNLSQCFKDLGLHSRQIKIIKRFEEAKKYIIENQPKVVVTEYDIDGQMGLQLLEEQEKIYDELSRIAIIATKNQSDSAVAEAAEEPVDLFILKPFSTGLFKQMFVETIESKLNPTAYFVAVQAAKRFLLNNQLPQAERAVLQSKTLNPEPALACYYLGQIYERQEKKNEALAEYREGRRFQPLHYKCLVAEFDLLTVEKKYPEALELMEKITKNFPLTPDRLGKVFMTAVLSYRFDLLNDYYELYLSLETRPPELSQLISMALLTAGRVVLKKEEIAEACWLFELGSRVSGRDFGFLEGVINELLRVGAISEAKSFFLKISKDHYSNIAFKKLEFLIEQGTIQNKKAASQ